MQLAFKGTVFQIIKRTVGRWLVRCHHSEASLREHMLQLLQQFLGFMDTWSWERSRDRAVPACG